MKHAISLLIIFLAAVSSLAQTPDPLPVLPIPTARQLAWQEQELIMFVHFTVNTFTDREWGDGTEEPSIFAPTAFDARQWVRVAKETGFQTVILTAKHHDGFALWPSRMTEHDVASSPWMDGQGDVVGALANAVEDAGLRMGLYLSPWDRHEPSYGDTRGYNQFYLSQLRELLTQYGPVYEVWFDGAKGADAKDMEYDFDAFWATVRQLQPQAVLFSDAGPDVRWIGNEHGFAGETNWSMLDRAQVTIGAADTGTLNSGDPDGPDWVPGECDVSIRPGWFWHADEQPKTLDELLEIYYKSVGRNCVLLLNVPPDQRGLLPEEDVARLYAFRAALDRIFTVDLALHAEATASNVRGDDPRFAANQVLDHDLATYWATDDDQTTGALELDLGAPATFNVVRLQEPIRLGQRIEAYRVEVWQDGTWQPISQGTTIGYKKLDRVPVVTAQRVRLVIEAARATPLIAEFGLHLDEISTGEWD